LIPIWATMARDVVAVDGPDAASYLQGQVSQDVEALGVGDSAWTFVLQPTGKVDGFARLWRRGDDDFVLDTDAGAGEALVARLVRFRLRVKADVAAVPGWRAIAVRGEGAATAAGLGALPGWWGSVDAPDLLGPDVTPPSGVQEIDAAALERLRIEAGWPAVGAELTPDTIPAEAGVVPLAVSFTKGCFTGQELVARIDSRGGNVPRHLRRLRAAGGSGLEVGAPIVVAGKDVGVVTSTAGGVALGYAGRAVVPPATGTAGGVDVAIEEIVPPP
jgi:tRNA-modifying protein YgfZ